ncbi:hypothetical protein [Cryptosporangium japonicum]|uniref:Uncharacterized protein n=1 Tax=Cryptosporangium japonicum TaxID=80872 RepID=A0ABN0UY77_9ACTN
MTGETDGFDPLWSLGRFVPGYRLGKYLRFRRSAVLARLEEHADET